MARGRDIDRAAENWGVPSAQQYGLPPMEPGRIGPTDGQRRDVVQRGLNGLERVGEASLAGSWSAASRSPGQLLAVLLMAFAFPARA